MMKETFYTPGTIDQVAASIHNSLKPFIRPERCPFQPAASALLVLDMQRRFLEETSHAFIPAAPAIVPGINRAIAAFQKAKRPVILTRHTNTDADAGTMARWWPTLMYPENDSTAIDPSVEFGDAMILNKTRYDAFRDTSLKDILLRAGVQCVVITGVMTHICCDSTARSAFQHGFDTYIAIDGTATYTRALHDGALMTLAHACAKPGFLSEFLIR